ncbi:MAG: NAD(P)-dependent oxidoreductase [Chitinophagales bacterium]|jgi:glutamate synthase (NADPH/NADH) small chain|nr:NAD(P)-dependent oxidoreductase [Chitinophagales bacterium]HNI44856.1 NAD(P)-dependent oxidoreductase [Chitinophagales bacterium]
MIHTHRLNEAEYTQNFADIHPPFETHEGASIEANRCLFCYDAPCTKSCPTSIDVPKFIKQIATENIKGAAKTIFDSNIMGAGCSRVCPVEKLCEGACVYNLLHESPIAIARLQRYATAPALENNWQFYSSPSEKSKKVAVVGAGPAGLACAHALAQKGVAVSIFEKEPKGGGLMTYGVAGYKVTPEFCEEEVQWILGVGGIDIQYGVELGKDVQLADLQAQYDAVFLAIGVGVARPLQIEGEALDGVVNAISFIYDIRTKDLAAIPVGDAVAVIGMGMTAIDAATQAKRLGAKKVTMIYRRTENEKPCTDAELDLARLDGCEIIWLAAPHHINGQDGKVTEIVCSEMVLGEPDASGRRSPVDTGHTFTLPVDMVIKATGQLPYRNLLSEVGVQFSNETHDSGSTNLKGVFAGGDCVNGGKEVVDAVQAGKVAAASICDYLFG